MTNRPIWARIAETQKIPPKMKEADKISEKHTFVLITDTMAEYFMDLGLFRSDELFNVPIPKDSKYISHSESEDKALLKTIYQGGVEFYN